MANQDDKADETKVDSSSEGSEVRQEAVASSSAEPESSEEASGGPDAEATAARDQIEIEKLDGILAQEDPQFTQSLGELGDDLNDGKIDPDLLDLEQAYEEGKPASGRWATFRKRISWSFKFFRVKLSVFFNIILDWIWLTSRYWLTEGWKKGLQGAVTIIRSVFARLLGAFSQIRSWSKKRFALFGLSLLLVSLTLFVVREGLDAYSLLRQMREPFLPHFRVVATRVIEFDREGVMDGFFSSARHQNEIFRTETIVVNLRAERRGGRPMALFQVYISGESRDSVRELKLREVEMRDRISRVMEGFTYRELESAEGKERALGLIREELNGALSFGRIRQVFFHTIVLKGDF